MQVAVMRSPLDRTHLSRLRGIWARRGFTLVELLVSLAILGVLTALLLAWNGRMIASADGAKCAVNLRTIGQAVALYVGDNSFPMPARPPSLLPLQGQLPGPLNRGQIPVSSRKYQGMFAYLLYPYLQLPEPTTGDRVVPLLQCPAWKKQTKNPTGVCYYCPNEVFYEKIRYVPFGYPNDSNPLRMVALPPVPLSEIVVLEDVDKTTTGVAGADWESALPAGPVHNGKRNTLYLDGHIARK